MHLSLHDIASCSRKSRSKKAVPASKKHTYARLRQTLLQIATAVLVVVLARDYVLSFCTKSGGGTKRMLE